VKTATKKWEGGRGEGEDRIENKVRNEHLNGGEGWEKVGWD